MRQRAHRVVAVRSLLIASALTLASCGGKGDAGGDARIVGSCNTAATGMCIEYGAGYEGLTLDRLCASQKGVYSAAGACPAEGRAGSCRVERKKAVSTYRYYAGFPGYGVTLPEGVAAAAEEACVNTIKGAWSAN